MKLLDSTLVYEGQEKFLLAVDCIIFGFDMNSIKLLLFKRKVEPFKGSWSLIGAFMRKDLTLNKCAKQILLESTGLKDVYLEEIKTYSEIDRDSGERVISVSYFSLIRIDELKIKEAKQYDAHWFDLEEIPELIFDHKIMVEDAIEKLRKKARYQPIGFNLLPEKFTIPQLQILYECIHQKSLDMRNFRKKIMSLDILTKTDEKDTSGSKKGAFLYSFNKEKFQKLIEKGYNFEI
ncbi:8-oxo-dGTP diphosphatase [Flavobacteriaceae bacterium UJ101]|nr:8-oxo-dGTP diphosphatase [Flavobacteriaceae bacterium UJ101]